MKSRITSISLIMLFVLTALLSLTVSLTQASPDAMFPHAPADSDYTLIHPDFVYDYYGHNSTLHLQNPNNTGTNVVLEFYGNNGTTTLNQVVSAYGTLILPADEVTGLSSGSYSLIISSDQLVHSVINITSSTSDMFAAYNGIHPDSVTIHQPAMPYTSSTYIQTFGPYLDTSWLVLQNLGTAAATVVVEAYASDGILIAAPVVNTVAAGDRVVISPNTLPRGFVGLAVISSDQPIDGILSQTHIGTDSTFDFQNSLGLGDTQAYMPRVFKHVNEGDGSRSTILFVANTTSASIDATLGFYAESGTLDVMLAYTLPAYGSEFIELLSFSLTGSENKRVK